MTDDAFDVDADGLRHALGLLQSPLDPGDLDAAVPGRLPERGIGGTAALDRLAPPVLGAARRLDAPTAFAHMDPPTPWIAWAATLWTARLNQNLLHPDTAPVARDVETRVVQWLAPFFGMTGGHMTPGSTVANLTALWAAREVRGVRRVVASDAAHLSIAKAAHLLGLEFQTAGSGPSGALDPGTLPDDLSDACLVLTAGTTSAGAVDPLALAGRAAWTHVDAAWAGPLRLSAVHADRLAGIEGACSVAVSAHKWLFQPKESALVLFRDAAAAHAAVSFGGAYLAVPNVGVLGSHGAVAVPLLATLLAWGREGVAARIDRAMAAAEALHARLADHSGVETFRPPVTGVVLWRPADGGRLDAVYDALPAGTASRTQVGGRPWLRHVAANPMADGDAVWQAIAAALG